MIRKLSQIPDNSQQNNSSPNDDYDEAAVAESDDDFDEDDQLLEDEQEIPIAQTTYTVPDGNYISAIEGFKSFNDRNGMPKLLLSLLQQNGDIFVTTQPIPLNSNTAFGSCMLQLKQQGYRIVSNVLIGAKVRFTVVNKVAASGRTYSQITDFRIIK